MFLAKDYLLRKKSVFLNDFEDEGDVFSRFCTETHENVVILFANYTYHHYNGEAYVLGYDKNNDMFFEVHGSHCSCYGLEGQWEPEFATEEELSELMNRRLNSDSMDEELKSWLMTIELV